MPTASETVDETEAEAPPRPSLVLRLKRLLAAPLLLRRLRRPKAETEGEEAVVAEARDARREESDVEEARAAAAPLLWRRLLPYGLVLLAGASAGSGGVYWLSAQIIARQAAGLNELQEEVTRLKGVLAGYDKMMLQNKKKLEEEQGRRAEAENRLAMAQADLARQPPPAARSSTSAQGPSKNSAGAGKAGDCTLRPGSIGSTLKDCLAEFNRR